MNNDTSQMTTTALMLAAAQRPSPDVRAELVGRAWSLLNGAAGAGGAGCFNLVAEARSLVRTLDPAAPEVQEVLARAELLQPSGTRSSDTVTTAIAVPEKAEPSSAVAASNPVDLESALAEFEAAQRALEAQETTSAQFAEQLTQDEAAEREAKREALPTEDESAAWQRHALAAQRAAKSGARSEAACEDLLRLRASVADQKTALLRAQFDDARQRGGLAALDTLLVERGAVNDRKNVLREEARTGTRRQQLALEAAVAQQTALEEVYSFGRALGLSHIEITELRLQQWSPNEILGRIDLLAREALASEAATDGKAAQ